MAGETVVLDPSEIAQNRTEFDITNLVGVAGPDWGDAAITQYLADAGEIGQVAVDFVIPNRTITIPIVLQDHDGQTFAEARTKLQQKAGLFQRKHGWIKRTTATGVVFAEVINAQLKLGGSTAQALQDVDQDASLVLTTLPDWFGDEVDLGTSTVIGEASIVPGTLSIGDYPGRCRFLITDASGHNQSGLLWSVRSYHYDGTATSQVGYEAENLTPLGTATVTTVSGASGGVSNNVVKRLSLPTTLDAYNPVWTPVVSTRMSTINADLTHVGSYRVWARVQVSGNMGQSLVQMRFSWQVGDLLFGSSNAATAVIPYSNFYIMDLGEVRLDEAPIGDHRWQGHIEVMSTAQASPGIPSPAEAIAIDRIWIVPVDEGAGILRAPVTNDAVVFAGKPTEVRTDGCWRLSPSGIGYDTVAEIIGDLPRYPASGMENRDIEVFIKPSRSLLDERTTDAGIDEFTVQILYRPSFLIVD